MYLQSFVSRSKAILKKALTVSTVIITLNLGGNLLVKANVVPVIKAKQVVAITPDANGILYVKQANTTSGTGDSWENAVTEFGDALKAAADINAVNRGRVKEIWIAGGVHKPLYAAEPGTTDVRNRSFVLVDDVKIFGGFAGTEAVLTERDLSLKANATVLTGDLNSDDGTDFSNYDDNVYHVMIVIPPSRATSDVYIDGLTIQGGNANSTGSITVNEKEVSHKNGGGIYAGFSTQIKVYLNNVDFYRNRANSLGGAFYSAIFNRNNSADIFITNTKMIENYAAAGAAVYNDDRGNTLYITNALVSGNTADNYIFGAQGRSARSHITNATIVNNKLNDNGAIIAPNSARDAAYFIRNSVVVNNTANTQKLLMVDINTNITNNLIETAISSIGTNINAVGLSLNDVFVDPAAGNFTLRRNSLVINKGNNSRLPQILGQTVNVDLIGKTRIYDDIVDIGAYEWHPTLANLDFTNLQDDKIVVTYGDADFTPSSTSTLPVTFSVPDANGKASIVDNKIHILEAGEVEVTLNFAGDAIFEPATLTKTLLIKKATQTINFPLLNVKQTNSPDFEAFASTISNLPLTYTSSNTSVADVYQDIADGNKWKIKIKGVGETDITAIQIGNVNYLDASLSRTLQVIETTLPVVLINYDAKLATNKVKLTWTTQSEQNNSAFILSYATDGKNFKVIAELQGKVTTTNINSYAYEHLSPLAGTNYYKLQQLDFNGDVKELGIKTIDFKLTNNISLYPNPVTEKAIITFDTGYQAIEIINVNGTVLQTLSVSKTDTSKEISLANYPSAIYFVKLVGINKMDILKVIKN